MNFYNPYSYNYQQQNMNYQQQTQQNSNYISFFVVSNKEDVDRYIVSPNQTVNLYDNVNGIIYSKSADNLGKYTTRVFQLKEINNNNTSNNNDFVLKNDFLALEKTFNERLNDLSTKLENLLKNGKEGVVNE